jgi:CubicO group peptidase (beta-lactamase class C family)
MTLQTPEIAAALEHAVALGERNVQVAAYLGDELIVDARIGPAAEDAVYPLFSMSKAFTALAAHLQAQRGLLDLDAPLAEVWPAYGGAGKEAITPAMVLSHRAGVPQAPPWLTPQRLGDWDDIVAALAELEPLFDPGTTNAYHSLSFGWLLGEAVARTDPQRRPFGRFVAEELCAPLGVDALWLGIPDAVVPRVARLEYPDAPPSPPPLAPVRKAVPLAVSLGPDAFNRPEVQRACVPAVGGIGDARSAARLFSLLATRGAGLLDPERVEAMLRPRPDVDGIDVIYGRALPVGLGGLWIEAPGVTPPGRRGQVLSHPGAGGTVAWAELDLGLSVAICHDRMFGAVDEHPFARLGEAVRRAAAAHG